MLHTTVITESAEVSGFVIGYDGTPDWITTHDVVAVQNSTTLDKVYLRNLTESPITVSAYIAS
jgi:hypothetical protein